MSPRLRNCPHSDPDTNTNIACRALNNSTILHNHSGDYECLLPWNSIFSHLTQMLHHQACSMEPMS